MVQALSIGAVQASAQEYAVTNLSLGGSWTEVTDMNESGQTVGWATTPGNVYSRAFIAAGGRVQDLGTLGGSHSFAYDINEAGQVVGHAQNAAGHHRAFLYDGTTMHSLTLAGVVSQLITAAVVTGFNGAGHVAGYRRTGPFGTGDIHAFLYDGTMHDLGTFGGNYSNATDVNQAGQVVGVASDVTNTWSAFLYDGTVIRNLNDHIPNAPAGMHLFQAFRISDNGSIVARSNTGWVLLSSGVNGHAPAAGPISLDVDPVPAGTTVTASAAFTDADTADTHTAHWTWGDGSGSPAAVSENGGAGDAVGTHTFSAAGIYPVSLTITDSTGLTAQVSRDVAVYDPSAGFVTGGGWIMSPMGAYRPDTTLEGPATFGPLYGSQREFCTRCVPERRGG